VKYSLTCQVDSRLVLEQPMKSSIAGYECEFIPNQDKLLHQIKMTAPVPDPRMFFSRPVPPTAGKPGTIVVGRDPKLHYVMIQQFQKLESLLAFASRALDRIYWSEPEDEVICETDEERAQVSTFGFTMAESYDKFSVRLKQKDLDAIASIRDRFDHLIIPMAFWREGQIDFQAFRYINAFFNFYFVLEGLFGAGKTQNSAIEKEFLASAELKTVVEHQIERYLTDKRPRHRERIKGMLSRRSKSLDFEGIVHLLVRTRGELHHFTNNTNRLAGTPFTQRAFETVAHLASVLSFEALSRQTIFVNQKHGVGPTPPN